jgi:hypothetical protein
MEFGGEEKRTAGRLRLLSVLELVAEELRRELVADLEEGGGECECPACEFRRSMDGGNLN